MRSGISCFNRPLFLKNWKRFWPIWALYLVTWLVLIPLSLASTAIRDNLTLSDTQQIVEFLSPGVLLAFCYGLAAAMAVFQYLYNIRSACMVHALPMDRNTLFVTNWWSGLAFLLAPNAGIFLITLALEALYGCLSVSELCTWLLGQSACCLFFFSFACFCAMFTGHILALPAFYGILNFLLLGMNYLLAFVMSGFLYGMSVVALPERLVNWCTPALRLYDACRMHYSDQGYSIEEPRVLAIYAAVGLALALLALLIYQNRHVETAGDVVSVPWMRPVFKYGFAFCVGIAFGTGTAVILDFYENDKLPLTALVLLWSVVGYFAGEMLLKKSFRVLGSWRGAAVLALVLCLGLATLAFDLLGFERRVPSAGDVLSLSVGGNIGGYPDDSGRWLGLQIDAEDSAQIDELLSLHRAVVNSREREGGDDFFTLHLTYTLKNGSTLVRSYHSVPLWRSDLSVQGSVTQAAQSLLDDRTLVGWMYRLDYYDGKRVVDAFVENTNYFRGYEGSRVYLSAWAGELWEAVKQDFAQGNLGVRYLFDDEARWANTCPADLYFFFVPEGDEAAVERRPYDNVSITLSPNARNVRAVLERAGVLEEYPGLLDSWSAVRDE